MLKNFSRIKYLPAIFISAFAAVFLIQIAAATALFLLPAPAQAADPFKLEVPIGSFASVPMGDSTKPIAQYIQAIYTYAVGAVGVVAAVVLMIGGVMWITAGGNASNVSEAKSMITASLTGMVLVLCSYLLLDQVNPALVDLKADIINPVTSLPLPSSSRGCSWTALTTQKVNGNQTIQGCSDVNLVDAISVGGSCGDISTAPAASHNDTTGVGTFYTCCCSPSAAAGTGANWSYQSGIAAQEKDASPQIDSLIACLKAAIPATIPITINSISDSQITPGGKTFADCRATGCSHTANSCHYGGKNGPDKSYAVDLGGDANAISTAARGCPDVKFINPEGSHIHVSVLECQSDQKNVEAIDQ